MYKRTDNFLYTLTGFFAGVGLMIATLGGECFRCVGISIAILAVLLLFYMAWKDSYRGQIKSLKDAMESHEVVWGLWHNAEESLGDRIISNNSPIKKLLLFDPTNEENLQIFVDRSPSGYTKEQAKSTIKTFSEKALDAGIHVKWYQEPSQYSLTIFDKGSEDEFTNKAWIYYQPFIPKSSKKERPPKTIKKSKDGDMFSYLVKEYNRIYDSLPLLTKELIKEKFERQ